MPRFRNQVSRIPTWHLEPSLWSYGDLSGVGAEPSSPPTEAAVGYDMVLAQAYQAQVLVILIRIVVGNKG